VEAPACHIVDSLSGGPGAKKAPPMDVRQQQEQRNLGGTSAPKIRGEVCLLVRASRAIAHGAPLCGCTQSISRTMSSSSPFPMRQKGPDMNSSRRASESDRRGTSRHQGWRQMTRSEGTGSGIGWYLKRHRYDQMTGARSIHLSRAFGCS
jgi:hypothetical protein